jgi:hypothetical protein
MSLAELAPSLDVPKAAESADSRSAPVVHAPNLPIDDRLIRRIYFASLGLISLLAFVSLWTQIHGLFGEQGLLPASQYFVLAREKLGPSAYWQLPSFCWFASNDLMLHVWCGLGSALSIVLSLGYAPRLVLVLLWSIYLSLVIAGQAFLSFQWDSLLLEMFVCSMLYAPRGLQPDWSQPPLPIARWIIWGLAFKLMFLSGVTKLLSGDSAWSDGSALMFHYYTQPIPSWPAWYACQMPIGVHQASLVVMFVVEVALPFLTFFGRSARATFGMATILLMLVIEATGNFGFFNLQTIVLCLPLLSDTLIRRLIPNRWTTVQNSVATSCRPLWRIWVGHSLATCVLCLSVLTIVRESVRTSQPDKLPKAVSSGFEKTQRLLLSWSEPRILDPVSGFRSVNGYGLFRVMTTRRPEIVVEISRDGVVWSPIEFRFKPGHVDRAPAIVAPHMPRLDWQMWFAALNPRGNGYWLDALLQRILEGNPKVLQLLGHPELARDPPTFARLAYYEYKFTTAEHRRGTGAWWSRSHLGELTGTITRRDDPP